MVVDGKGESPSRLTSAVEGAEQRPIYHAAFDDVEYISAVPTRGSIGLTAGAEWIRTFGSAMRWHLGLHRSRTVQSIDHTTEFDEEPVACRLDQSTVVRSDRRINQLGPDSPSALGECRPRPLRSVVSSLRHRPPRSQRGGGLRSFLGHPGLAETGKVSGFAQVSDLRCTIMFDGS